MSRCAETCAKSAQGMLRYCYPSADWHHKSAMSDQRRTSVIPPAAPAHSAAFRNEARRHAVRADDANAFVPVPGTKSKKKRDDSSELLAEEFVASATSGEEVVEDEWNQELVEERGGPFVETSAKREFAEGTDLSESARCRARGVSDRQRGSQALIADAEVRPDVALDGQGRIA